MSPHEEARHYLLTTDPVLATTLDDDLELRTRALASLIEDVRSEAVAVMAIAIGADLMSTSATGLQRAAGVSRSAERLGIPMASVSRQVEKLTGR